MKQKQEKLETKMKWMLLSTMIPMTILIIVLLVFFWHYTNEYNQLSNNLAVSSEITRPFFLKHGFCSQTSFIRITWNNHSHSRYSSHKANIF